MAKELSESNALWLVQDGLVDLTQINNYFHGIRYVNKYGDLKFAFLSLEEKQLCGANGQWQCPQESLVSLYPNSGFVTSDNVIEMPLQKHALSSIPEEDDAKEESEFIASIDRMDTPF